MTRILFQSRGAPEFRFLSNFWFSPMVLDGLWYATVEHLYQSAKAAGAEREAIRTAPTPHEARRLGQLVALPDSWASRRLPVMGTAVWLKFKNAELRQMLLATDDAELVEFAPWGDRFWGVDRDLVGENNLGKILMATREKIREEGKR